MNLDEDEAKNKKRREELAKKQSEWETKKKELLQQIKFQSDNIEMYLGKVERGLDYTSDIEHHLGKMKEMFETIRETEHDLKYEANAVDQEDEDIKWERERGTKSVAGAIREAAYKLAVPVCSGCGVIDSQETDVATLSPIEEDKKYPWYDEAVKKGYKYSVSGFQYGSSYDGDVFFLTEEQKKKLGGGDNFCDECFYKAMKDERLETFDIQAPRGADAWHGPERLRKPVTSEPEYKAFTKFRFPSQSHADSAWEILKKHVDWGSELSLGMETGTSALDDPKKHVLGVPKKHEAEVSDILDRAKIPYVVDEGVSRRASLGDDKWKVTARFEGAREPFVDWFDADDEAGARKAWEAEAKDCGVPAHLITTAKLTIEPPKAGK